MDLAQLTLGVDSSPLKEGQSWLQKLADQALGTAKDTDKLNDSLAGTSTASGKMSSAIDRMLGPLASFKGLLAGVFAGFSLNMLGGMADTWSDVSSRVGVAIGDMEGADAVMQRLTTTARLTYSSLSQTAEGFVRNSTVLQALGKSTQEQIAYTEALNLALVASGTKGQQALSVQEALSKGMTNGKLATEQLQTVLNNSSEVSKALADELGTTVLGLADLAKQGRVTGDVIFNALTKRLDEFTKKAEEMPATLGDGFLLIGNALTALVGSFDQVSGVTQFLAGLMVGLSDGILWVATNIDQFTVSADTLEKILWTVAPAMIAAFGPTVLGMVGSLIGVVGTGLVGAFVSLRTVMLAHPLVFWGTVIATIISYMHNWVDAFPLLTQAFEWLYEKAMYVLETIKLAIQSIWGELKGEDGEITVRVKGDDAASKMGDAIRGGGASAAGAMKDGITAGGASAAQMMQSAQEAAVSKYEAMNGKAAKELGATLIEGGKYIYNQATGEVKAAGDKAATSMKEGGTVAAETMKQSIEAGGKSAGGHIFNSVESAFATLADVFTVFQRFIQRERMELAKIQAETLKLEAEARKADAEATAIRQGGSSGSKSGGGSFSGGGSAFMNDPFSQINTEAQAVPSNSTPGTTVSGTPTPVNVQNVLDPHLITDSLDTASGHQAIVNVIKYNREELQAILGSV